MLKLGILIVFLKIIFLFSIGCQEKQQEAEKAVKS